MCCVLLLAGGIGPRIALFFWWIFGDKPDAAISSWVWGLLGFLFLPWTTLMYIIAWSPIIGIDDAEGRVASLRQLGGDLDEALEQRVEREL